MTATFLKRDDGNYIEVEYVSALFTGKKWYWIEHDDGSTNKLPTSQFTLMSVEA